MIATLPVSELAPLEYRYALDAVMPLLGKKTPLILRCGASTLLVEVAQRLIWCREAENGAAALWVEPQRCDWEVQCRDLGHSLAVGAPLAIIASRPLARLLPELKHWGGDPLGFVPWGIEQLCRALNRCGFACKSTFGIHSIQSISIFFLSRCVSRLGHPALGDRLVFAARLRYCLSGPLAGLSTVNLIIAWKQ
jgi:hypothetical protein